MGHCLAAMSPLVRSWSVLSLMRRLTAHRYDLLPPTRLGNWVPAWRDSVHAAGHAGQKRLAPHATSPYPPSGDAPVRHRVRYARAVAAHWMTDDELDKLGFPVSMSGTKKRARTIRYGPALSSVALRRVYADFKNNGSRRRLYRYRILRTSLPPLRHRIPCSWLHLETSPTLSSGRYFR